MPRAAEQESEQMCWQGQTQRAEGSCAAAKGTAARGTAGKAAKEPQQQEQQQRNRSNRNSRKRNTAVTGHRSHSRPLGPNRPSQVRRPEWEDPQARNNPQQLHLHQPSVPLARQCQPVHPPSRDDREDHDHRSSSPVCVQAHRLPWLTAPGGRKSPSPPSRGPISIDRPARPFTGRWPSAIRAKHPHLPTSPPKSNSRQDSASASTSTVRPSGVNL
jgi:hypothetical protein